MSQNATRSIDVAVILNFPATQSNEFYYSVSPQPKENFMEYLFKLLMYVYVDHDFRRCGGS